MQLRNSVFRITGIVVVTSSLLWLLFIGWSIYASYGDCQGGLSPQPSRGCGYVLHLALYVWGDSYYVLYGVVALVIGLVLFFLSKLKRLRPESAFCGAAGVIQASEAHSNSIGIGACRNPQRG